MPFKTTVPPSEEVVASAPSLSISARLRFFVIPSTYTFIHICIPPRNDS